MRFGFSRVVSWLRRLSWPRRILLVFVVLFIILMIQDFVFELVSLVLHKTVAQEGMADECRGVVFICLGDSMTWGKGAGSGKSYPLQIVNAFRKLYPGIPVKVYNLAMQGTNTTNAFYFLKQYFDSTKDTHPDFALIMYGMNNRWNLSGLTDLGWDDSRLKKYLPVWNEKYKIVKPAGGKEPSMKELVNGFSTTSGAVYKTMMDKYGWNMFFDDFTDEFLSTWIKSDFTAIAGELRSRGVEPIFLTYHYDCFGTSNPLIREASAEARVSLIDLEETRDYYLSRGLFNRSFFHLNAKGYGEVAQRIVAGFHEIYSEDDVIQMLAQKRKSPACKAQKKPSHFHWRSQESRGK